MRIALLADTHFGVRGDSQIFIDQASRFFREVFFPALHKNSVGMVIHLGDLVDRRKFLTYTTCASLREEFLTPLNILKIPTVILCGNHDATYKNTNKVNALREILGGRYDNIRIQINPGELELGQMVPDEELDGEYVFESDKILLLPWITDDNRDSALDYMKHSKARIALGHLELAGFKHYKNTPEAAEGMDPSLLSRFDFVGSGHYHHKSRKGNIHYLGAPYEMNWGDHDDPRGFHILDTETLDLIFIENPFRIHAQLVYDGQAEINPEDYRDRIVKLIVQDKGDGLRFDRLMKSLDEVAAEIKVVDEYLHQDAARPEIETTGQLSETTALLRQAAGEDPVLTELLLETYREAMDR